MRQPWLHQVVLVLYRPWDVVNMAAVVRAMTNFGLTHLRLVQPAEWDPYRVKGIAHQADPVLAAVRSFDCLEAALADCTFVLGTTGRRRAVRRERLTPRQAAPALRQAALATAAPVAVLFGPERDGLPNQALDQCHALLTIPTGQNASLNLAQAAVVVAYELWLCALDPDGPATERAAAAEPAPADPRRDAPADPRQDPPADPHSDPPADPAAPPRDGELPTVLRALRLDADLARGADRTAMFAALADLLQGLYRATSDGRMDAALSRLRAILLRAAPRADEARMLTHLFRHLGRLVRAGAARDPGGC